MKSKIWLFLLATFSINCVADGLEGEVGLEGRLFTNEGLFGQDEASASIRLQPEYDYSFKNGDDSIESVLFYRADSLDSERSHGDIRELAWIHVDDGWETKVGISKVFWGVTESQHLVDIINQTDLIENTDGEDKLGQPMVKFSTEQDWGTLDLFWLPYQRERTFSGVDGRLRAPLEVDVDNARYASGAEQWHSDFAVRFTRSIGDMDIGLSHFSGISREPLLVSNGSFTTPKLVPLYNTIDQTGLDLQYIYEDWLLKFEGITRSGLGDRYSAATAGFEYTQVGVLDSRADLGWLAEYLFDDRGGAATSLFERDIFVGWRLALNDEVSSEVLFGVIIDPQSEEKFYSLEASRRINNDWSLELQSRIFSGTDPLNTQPLALATALANPDADEKTSVFQEEDYLSIELTRYF